MEKVSCRGYCIVPTAKFSGRDRQEFKFPALRESVDAIVDGSTVRCPHIDREAGTCRMDLVHPPQLVSEVAGHVEKSVALRCPYLPPEAS